MSEDMKAHVFEVSQKAVDDNQKTVDIAAVIKKDMDKKYGPTWHCIVGKNFGSFVSHEGGNFIYFYQGNLAILLFKTA